MSFGEITYIERAMRQGIVRTIYCVVPDDRWAEVVAENRYRNWIEPLKPTETGLVILREEGRVYLLPLSRFWPPSGEQALLVLESTAWNKKDLAHIAHLIRSGTLSTDLLAVVDDPGPNKTLSGTLMVPQE
jgi:hypothetical protein